MICVFMIFGGEYGVGGECGLRAWCHMPFCTLLVKTNCGKCTKDDIPTTPYKPHSMGV